MLRRIHYCNLIVVVLLSLFALQVQGGETSSDDAHTIWGIVMEQRSGTADVPVCLCDAATGLPLTKQTYQPIQWEKTSPQSLSEQMAIVLTNTRGRFRFENVPDGRYRLVAQKWMGPYKGVFEKHGTVIQLMGTADDIVVPRPTDYYKALIGLRPPGKRVVEFDQQVGNDETYMFLSTVKPAFDPVLGLHAMGRVFFQNMIGFNRMPYGKTTVIGAPNEPFYAFLIAADNSPGFVAMAVGKSNHKYIKIKSQPFIAGWSDGHKTPPDDLAELMRVMDEHGVTVSQLLNIPKISAKTADDYTARMKQLLMEVDKPVELPKALSGKLSWDRAVRIGDLLAVDGYLRLRKFERMRLEQKKRNESR